MKYSEVALRLPNWIEPLSRKRFPWLHAVEPVQREDGTLGYAEVLYVLAMRTSYVAERAALLGDARAEGVDMLLAAILADEAVTLGKRLARYVREDLAPYFPGPTGLSLAQIDDALLPVWWRRQVVLDIHAARVHLRTLGNKKVRFNSFGLEKPPAEVAAFAARSVTMKDLADGRIFDELEPCVDKYGFAFGWDVALMPE